MKVIAENHWRDNEAVIQKLDQIFLADLHTRIYIGDIVGLAKNNGVPEHKISAWRPIMCLNTIRKIITKIISNRVYRLIQTKDYQMLSPWQFGFQKLMGVPEALYSAKLTIHMTVWNGTN